MKRYRVKFKDIVRSTFAAVLLETWDGHQVWLPEKCIKKDYRYTKGIAYIVPEWLCEEKGLNGKLYEPYNRPEKIAPVYNQEAIDELKV